MSSTSTLKASLEEINSFLMFLSDNTTCISIKQDGVDCFYVCPNTEKGCIHCLSRISLVSTNSRKLELLAKIIERIQAGDECLYEEKEYL